MRRVVRGHEVAVEVDGFVAVEGVAELVAELGEEAGGDEGRGGGVDAGFALGERGVSLGVGEGRKGRTWPPEKPTATTPSSSGWERNLDSIIEVLWIWGRPKARDPLEWVLVGVAGWSVVVVVVAGLSGTWAGVMREGDIRGCCGSEEEEGLVLR